VTFVAVFYCSYICDRPPQLFSISDGGRLASPVRRLSHEGRGPVHLDIGLELPRPAGRTNLFISIGVQDITDNFIGANRCLL